MYADARHRRNCWANPSLHSRDDRDTIYKSQVFNPTSFTAHMQFPRKRGDRRCHVLASASVRRLRVGLVLRGSAVPVSMRSLGTDRSLGKFPPAGRLSAVEGVVEEAALRRHVAVLAYTDDTAVQYRSQQRLLTRIPHPLCRPRCFVWLTPPRPSRSGSAATSRIGNSIPRPHHDPSRVGRSWCRSRARASGGRRCP